MSSIKFIGTGGLGDSFIVFCKIASNVPRDKKVSLTWIESNEIVPALVKQYIESGFFGFDNISVDGRLIPDYTQQTIDFLVLKSTNKISRLRQDRIFLNTRVDGKICFRSEDPEGYKINDKLFDEFKKNRKINYDVSIQCSAGAKANRRWPFDPRNLALILRQRGMKVCIVGSDKSFADNHPDNYVCKTSLLEAMKIVNSSSCHIGLSGFHCYWSSACGVKNIQLMESDSHNEHYLLPSWRKNVYSISVPSIPEIIKLI
jgi:hypothetical protein